MHKSNPRESRPHPLLPVKRIKQVSKVHTSCGQLFHKKPPFSTNNRRFSLVFLCTLTYLPNGDSSTLTLDSQSSTSANIPGANVTPFLFCSTHFPLSSIRSTSPFTTPTSFPDDDTFFAFEPDDDLAALMAFLSTTTSGTTSSGNATLPCTGLLANHSARRYAVSWTSPSAYTRVLRYCCGVRIWTSKSMGRRVEDLGRVDGVRVDVRMGRM